MPKISRPKALYINVPLELEDEKNLLEKGWEPIDVRTLPSKTDKQKADTIKAWLEGVRQGSIQPEKDIIKLIELEAKAYGLVGTKTITERDEPTTTDEVVDDLLDTFASKRVVKTSNKQRPRTHSPKGGHPKTSRFAPTGAADVLTKTGARRLIRNVLKEPA